MVVLFAGDRASCGSGSNTRSAEQVADAGSTAAGPQLTTQSVESSRPGTGRDAESKLSCSLHKLPKYSHARVCAVGATGGL